MVIEKFNLSESAKKIHASRNRYQVHAHQFWLGVVSPVSEILLPFKNGQISLSGHGLYPWSSKNLINRNRLKKFMQVGVNVTCMYISFGGRGLSGFGDLPFKNGQIFLSGHGL